MRLLLWDKCANGATGTSDVIKHGFFTFSSIFFPNFLACERCLNTSICWFTTTSGLQYGSESFYNPSQYFPHLWANFHQIHSKPQKCLKRTSAQNQLDKTYKKKMEKGVASTSSVPGMCEAVKRGTIVCCLFLFLFLVLLCFVMCSFFIFAFHMKRSLELGKYYFISSKAVLPLKTGIYTTKTLGHCRDR